MASKKAKTPQKLGDLISDFLRTSGVKERDERRLLADAWGQAVGRVRLIEVPLFLCKTGD